MTRYIHPDRYFNLPNNQKRFYTPTKRETVGKFKFPSLKRKLTGSDLTFEDVRSKVEDTFMDSAIALLPEKEQLDAVLDKVVAWLDDEINYPGVVGKFIDTFDHVVVRFLLGLLVKEIYEEISKLDDVETDED